MGYCIDGDGEFDVFMSYASADNKLRNSWVTHFERYLTDMVRAALEIDLKAQRARADLFAVCRDQTGFPPSGVLSEIIDDKLRHSQFLFIFLGSGYLTSEWCLYELEVFRSKFGGDLSAALNWLYLIVLDPDALEALRETERLADAPPSRQTLWKAIQTVSRSVVRIQDFLRDGELVSVYEDYDTRYADPSFDKVGRKIVEDLAGKLVAMRKSATQPSQSRALPLGLSNPVVDRGLPGIGAQPPIPGGSARGRIVIGAVPERLLAARQALALALGSAPLQLVEESDLADPDLLRGRIEGASVVIQPYDRLAPIRGGILSPGGHLAAQRRAFEESRSKGSVPGDAAFVWWEPADRPVTDGPPAGVWDRGFLDGIGQDLGERKSSSDAQTLARELLPEPGASPVKAQIWIEWEEADRKSIKEAKEKVRERFAAHCRKRAEEGIAIDAALSFLTADWNALELKFDKNERPDGVVIVYNEHKDQAAFEQQSQRIANMKDVLVKKMFPGIFYMRLEGTFEPDDWSVVRFTRANEHLKYDPEELEEFVGRLFEVLRRKHLSADEGRAP